MTHEYIMTREIGPLPSLSAYAHKGDAGRLAVIGGCSGDVMMIGAPALAANAALRSGIGLVQMFVPQTIRTAVATLAPCATVRTLPATTDELLAALNSFAADVVAIGPGLGDSLDAEVVGELLAKYEGTVVVDADALNMLATLQTLTVRNGRRVVLTPHVGEAKRLLAARHAPLEIDATPASRRAAACTLFEAYGCVTVLKGASTIITNGDRLFTNETGNAGLATAGTGDVLTGVIAAFMGQEVEPFEAALLGVFLHGLAGDFATEELGRWAVTAADVIEYLPEAFCEHAMTEGE